MSGIPLKDGTDYKLPLAFRLELGEHFRDVDDELVKMRLWCLANEHRRKTIRGVRKFIIGWLMRSGKQIPKTVPQSILRAEVPITPEERERNKERIAQLKASLRPRVG